LTKNFSRRRFLKGIGGAVAATSFSDLLFATASAAPQASATRATALVFWEADFPQIDGTQITREILEAALTGFDVSYLSEQQLIEQLRVDKCDLLVMPYGSAFPKRAWPAVLGYLRAGGNLLNLGGVPFAVPVIRGASRWQQERQQTAYHKKLGITQSFPVEAAAVAAYRVNQFGEENLKAKDSDNQNLANQFKAERIYELYVRFTSSNSIADEAGSDGPREAVLHPLVFGLNHEQRPVAAPIIQIDRLQGDFAGGRWVLANFSGRVTAAAIARLSEQAALGAIEFSVRSEFASYRPGEVPTFSVDLHRPFGKVEKGKVEKIIRDKCTLEVRDRANQIVAQFTVVLKGEAARATGTARLKEGTKLAPGFYRVAASQTVNDGPPYELTYTTGFWVYDEQLLTRGKPLSVDQNFFYRDGDVYPITGTTYMASDVHRQFLFDPNPAVWDRDFRAMKSAGVNLVRTGIWTGWKKFMPEAGKVNEAALRSLDAFLLTAHQYDIPVIFTFFAFLPETWGGKNAYLDPQAVQAQAQFVSAFAQRYHDVDDLIWDLINEPSFCSPKHLWSCRPNYDDFEKTAWRQWLRARYPAASDEERATRLQELWRTTGEATFDLPRLEDFDGINIFDDRRPLKTYDYRLFAQEMFVGWVQAMTAVIRKNGNQKQLITVGQDEGGNADSPSPHFFAGVVDFTCMHNWWANDDLVWDSVMAKSPAKASLIEETGIMFYEKMDGSAWRTEEEARNLLERKLAISFAVQGAGFVQWIWNANCYMNLDNEAAIGFHRADQTAKPELGSFLKITKFLSAHRAALRGREDEAVLMVIPHSQMFSPRNFATEVTRKCVRAMFYHCRIPLRAVSEYLLAETNLTGKLIIVPAPRVLTEKCWGALVAQAARGATIVISGVLDADEHWLSNGSRSVGVFGVGADTGPVSASESILIGTADHQVRYEGEKIQRIEKALMKANGPARVLVQSHGAGRFVWSPLPLEAGNSMTSLIAFYQFALAQANFAPVFKVSPDPPAILVLPSIFEKHALYTFVSETDRDASLTLEHHETRTPISVTIPAGRATFVLLDRANGRLIDSTNSSREPW
jgi:Cellulase (glycosyl hydrolase family 5)